MDKLLEAIQWIKIVKEEVENKSLDEMDKIILLYNLNCALNSLEKCL